MAVKGVNMDASGYKTMSDITQSRAAELVAEALAHSAAAMRRQAASRQLIGEQFAGARAGYRAKAAEFDALHSTLADSDARWEVGSAIVTQLRLAEYRAAGAREAGQ